jgi:hypothetical protein
MLTTSSWGGACQLTEVTNGRCLNINGNWKSINQDDHGASVCNIYAVDGCTGYTLPCSGDCPGLFVFENNFKSMRCRW